MKELIYSLGKDGLKSAYSLLQSFALYLTVAVAAILLTAYLIIRFKKTEAMNKFKTLALGVIVGYAVTVTACISFLMIARLSVKGELDANFFLMLGFFLVLFAYAVAAMISSLLNKKAFKIINIIGLSLIAVYCVILVAFIPTVKNEKEDYTPLSTVGMYIFTALLVAAILVPCVVFGKDENHAQNSKAISFAGVSIALSFALSYVKLFSLPQGGSITLASMLPLIVYAYIFGARKGVLAGAIYGVLQCLQNPQFYQPVQVLLDYPIAFSAIGLAGLFKNVKGIKSPVTKFVLGASVACVGRYLAHFLSGYYVFSSWAMEGYTALTWSLVYNLFIIAELAIILVAGAALFASKSFRTEIEKINPEKNSTEISPSEEKI